MVAPDKGNTDCSIGTDGTKKLEKIPNKELCQMNQEIVCTNGNELHAHFHRTGEYCSTEKIGKSTVQERTHDEQLNLL